MSVPKSNVLSCSRSFLAKTDLGYCSPKQSQNVNVVVSPQMCHYDANPNPLRRSPILFMKRQPQRRLKKGQ